MKKITYADFVSFISIFFGFVSVLFSISSQLENAAIFMVLAVVADFADGKIARFLNCSSDMGKNIDSLSDLISFGMAPAVFGYMIISSISYLLAAVLVFFLIACVYRLARWNISKSEGFYLGMPITLNGLIMPIEYFAGIASPANLALTFIIVSVLMASAVRIKKFV